MEDQLIKGMGSTTSGALVVTLLWFLRTVYKKYAGRNHIILLKLVNGQYAAKIRRGIGLLRWVRGKDHANGERALSVYTGYIVQSATEDAALGSAKNILARYGVCTKDRISVTRCWNTDDGEAPSL